MDNDAGSDNTPVGRAPATAGGALGPVIALAVAALALPLAVVLVVVCALVPGLPWWLGLGVAVALAAGLVVHRLRGAYSGLLRDLAVVPAYPATYPRYHNVAQGLSLAGGVAEPELFVIDDAGRNAVAVARGSRAAIAASTGLLDALDLIALEAVVAECLVRIGNGDAEAATVGAALFGPLLAGPARPLGLQGLRRLLAEDRDLKADRAAVALTRYPPGLAAALTAIASGSPRLTRVGAAVDHVWLVPPSPLDASPVPAETPSLTLRIDVLGEL